MLEKIKTGMDHQQAEKDQFNKAPSVKINIMYDKSMKDIGVLIKMNNLMKRLELVKYLMGDWKSTSNKYISMTD